MPANRPEDRVTVIHADTVPAPRGALLVTRSVGPPEQAVTVNPAGTALGRDSSCDLRLASSAVSRRHAIVHVRDGSYIVEDLGSHNGTTINGRPVVGAVPLSDGDRLKLADTEVEFRLSEQNDEPVKHAQEPQDANSWPTGPTDRWPPVDRATTDRRPLRKELHDSPGFSGYGLILAIAGSVVGTVLTSAAGTGPWGTLIGAALAPIITATFTTNRAGGRGRVRISTIIILSAAALVITWTGVSLADLVAGRSVLPGADERTSTFPNPVDTDAASRQNVSSGPAIEVTAELDCGTVAVGAQLPCPGSVTIMSIGAQPLHVTSVEVTGQNTDDFAPGEECVDQRLDTNQICEMTVQFAPSAEGQRTATLVVHQNLPAPDRGSEVTLVGAGQTGTGQTGCRDGYVPRLAVPDDYVCVTPATRDQVLIDSGLADSRRNPAGGPYGPDTCLDGFVWRVAVPSDLVCVTPTTRDQTLEDNLLADSRRAGG